MNALRNYLKVTAKRLRLFLGWQISLNDISLKEASKLLPKCKRININDTDKFRVQQLRKAARDRGFSIMSTGEIRST